MLEYFRLITTAAKTTMYSPQLWFFGIFLSAGFNFNFLFWHKQEYENAGQVFLSFLELSFAHSAVIGAAALVLFLLILIGLWLFVNWVKILFIYNFADLVQIERIGTKVSRNPIDKTSFISYQLAYIRQAKFRVWDVLALSFFTIVSQLFIGAILSAPWLWQRFVGPMPGLLEFSVTLLALFLFFLALLNFFSTLYTILYDMPFSRAVSSTLELLKFNSLSIGLFSMFVFGLYAIGIWLGRQVFSELLPLHLLWFGFINALFNGALILLFDKYNKPQKFEVKNLLTEKPAELASLDN